MPITIKEDIEEWRCEEFGYYWFVQQVTPTVSISEIRARRFFPSWRWWKSRNWESIDIGD